MNTPIASVTASDQINLSYAIQTQVIRPTDAPAYWIYTVLVKHAGRPVSKVHNRNWIHRFNSRNACRKAGREAVRALKKRRMFVIEVKRNDIEHGEARDCRNCAIANALWRERKRMGFDHYGLSIEVAPYAAWTEARGLVFSLRAGTFDGRHTELQLLPHDMPDLVSGRDHVYTESMDQWAMHFDEWAEQRYMSAKECRQEYGKDWYRQSRPQPAVFLLDLDAFNFTGTTK